MKENAKAFWIIKLRKGKVRTEKSVFTSAK